MWMDLVLLMVAVLPLVAEGRRAGGRSEAVAFGDAGQPVILAPVRIEAAQAMPPRR